MIASTRTTPPTETNDRPAAGGSYRQSQLAPNAVGPRQREERNPDLALPQADGEP